MNVSLTPALDEYVRGKLDSGHYGTASEVIREALRLMIAQDKRLDHGDADQLIAQGLVSPRISSMDSLREQVGAKDAAKLG